MSDKESSSFFDRVMSRRSALSLGGIAGAGLVLLGSGAVLYSATTPKQARDLTSGASSGGWETGGFTVHRSGLDPCSSGSILIDSSKLDIMAAEFKTYGNCPIQRGGWAYQGSSTITAPTFYDDAVEDFSMTYCKIDRFVGESVESSAPPEIIVPGSYSLKWVNAGYDEDDDPIDVKMTVSNIRFGIFRWAGGDCVMPAILSSLTFYVQKDSDKVDTDGTGLKKFINSHVCGWRLRTSEQEANPMLAVYGGNDIDCSGGCCQDIRVEIFKSGTNETVPATGFCGFDLYDIDQERCSLDSLGFLTGEAGLDRIYRCEGVQLLDGFAKDVYLDVPIPGDTVPDGVDDSVAKQKVKVNSGDFLHCAANGSSVANSFYYAGGVADNTSAWGGADWSTVQATTLGSDFTFCWTGFSCGTSLLPTRGYHQLVAVVEEGQGVVKVYDESSPTSLSLTVPHLHTRNVSVEPDVGWRISSISIDGEDVDSSGKTVLVKNSEGVLEEVSLQDLKRGSGCEYLFKRFLADHELRVSFVDRKIVDGMTVNFFQDDDVEPCASVMAYLGDGFAVPETYRQPNPQDNPARRENCSGFVPSSDDGSQVGWFTDRDCTDEWVDGTTVTEDMCTVDANGAKSMSLYMRNKAKVTVKEDGSALLSSAVASKEALFMNPSLTDAFSYSKVYPSGFYPSGKDVLYGSTVAVSFGGNVYWKEDGRLEFFAVEKVWSKSDGSGTGYPYNRMNRTATVGLVYEDTVLYVTWRNSVYDGVTTA